MPLIPSVPSRFFEFGGAKVPLVVATLDSMFVLSFRLEARALPWIVGIPDSASVSPSVFFDFGGS